MEVGGQAVIEGVMMRNKEKFAVAVRLPNGKIRIRKDKPSKFPKFFNVYFVRGVVGLGYTLVDGIKAIAWSSNQQLEKQEKLTKRDLVLTIGGSMIFALLLFVGLPFLGAHLIHSEGFLFDILDGIFRVALFLGYLLGISLLKDVKTLFQYHGAEHKTIFCYESGRKLTIGNVRKFTRFHPRCGTSFLFLVLIISIAIFSLITGPWWVELLGRILLLPVIAGISYELIKLSGRYYKNPIVKAVVAPGLWLQRITTKEPTDQQLEVGIKSLKAVVD